MSATLEARPATALPQATTPPFSFRQARLIIRDCFAPKPWIYWADVIVTVAIGYTAASIYLAHTMFSLIGFAAYIVAGFALFRAGTFIHEIVHMRRGTFVGFRTFWNLLCGIPMLTPSFFYENHADHHKKNHYGTHDDGEYLPLGAGPVRQIAFYFLQALLLPALVAIRFLILTPISFLHPKLRQWTLERASSYGINPGYRREIPKNAPRKIWALIEWACFVRTALIFAVVILGIHHWTRIPHLYALAVLVIGLNYIRNLTAHRYRNTGAEMSYLAQLEDSVNITGHPILTELFFPLGLRYHALHHLFPSIPYHALGKAHRKLMAELPANSAYHQTVCPSYWSVVRQLWADARAASAEKRPGWTV